VAGSSDGAPLEGIRMTSNVRPKEGLLTARLLLVLSSLSPAFLLWAVRGVKDVPDAIWVTICMVMLIVPNLFLYLMMRRTRQVRNSKTIQIKGARDQREHLLVYLFAMLVPLYDVNLEGYRSIAALSLAFAFIVFIFWHMKLHYMNVFLAMFGYQIFTVETEEPLSGDSPAVTTYAVITRRSSIDSGRPLTGYRLGGNVLLDTYKA
jgi:hypothetical protein